MKAAVFLGPGKIEVKEVETPKIENDEVLVKIETCTICGTDVRIFYHGQKNVVPPHIIGHEIAGTIVEIGKKVNKKYKTGQKVTVVSCVGCGKCSFCKKGYFNLCDTPRYIGYYYPGGFAQYMKVPAEAVKGNNIIVVPKQIDFPEISIIEPLSCCINGQEYLNIHKGDSVVIIGAGPIGCMHAELARAKGAELVVLSDISETRLELVKRFKDIILVNSSKEDIVQKVTDLTNGKGADVIIIACSVNQAQEQSLQFISKKGRISFFAGLPKDNPYIKFDSNIIHYKEVSVFGAFGSYRKQYEQAMDYIFKGKIEAGKFITHRFPLDKIVEGIETAKSGIGLKVVVEM